MRLKAGTLLKHEEYRIESVLGQGGFGITYLATHILLDEKVAIKEFFMKGLHNRDVNGTQVTVGSVGSIELVERYRNKFIKEARSIRKLKDPGVVSVLDVFEDNGTAYYTMEYISGGSLSDKVRDDSMSEADAVRYIRQVASTLEYIHGKQMMHLDIKPANILLDASDNAVLIDFGLAKQYDSDGKQTSTTPVGISHGYAPMEQYKLGGVSQFSPATDIYSLGATLYRIVTGEVPPEASDVNNDGIPLLSNDISYPVRRAIEAAMQPRCKDRPQSVSEFLRILDNKSDIEIRNIHDNTVLSDNHIQLVDNEDTRVGDAGFLIDEATCVSNGELNGHDYVDLGLPSRVKWATCNIGADSPEKFGHYYAWDETKKNIMDSYGDKKDTGGFWRAKNRFNFGGMMCDIARTKWGDNWRMPTHNDFYELINNCSWIWDELNGIKGYKVVSNINGNSIFLPAAGCRKGIMHVASDFRTYGYYWSDTQISNNSPNVYGLYFSEACRYTHFFKKTNGFTIRPVFN